MMATVALVLLLVAAPALPAESAPTKRQLGCYWYPREARAPVTNRSLSSLPAGTCDYVDIAGSCLLVLDAQGRLAWAQRQGPAGHSAIGTCAELAGRTAVDARGARRASPSVQFFWQVGGTQAAMMAVFNSSAKRATAVSELRRFQSLYPDVVNGFAFDYEYHYDTVPPDPHFCVGTSCLGAVKRGLTDFLRSLTAATGRGVHWWTGGLTWFANTCDVAAIQPYVEVVELAAYWTPDPFNLTGAASWKSVDELGFRTPNPHIMNPNDTQILRAPPYSYTSEQLMVGAGLSSFSYLDVPKAVLPICAYTGYLGFSLPTCNTSGFPAVAASGPPSHSSIGASGTPGRSWEMIEADVASGRAVRMANTADRPGFGPLSSYWLYYPDAGTPGRGEVTWWNSQAQLDGFIETVKLSELGGVFTWTSTSDAADWRVHKRLHAQLAALL